MAFWRKILDAAKAAWRAVTPAPAPAPAPEPPRTMAPRLFLKRPPRARRPKPPPPPREPSITKAERDRARRRAQSAELKRIRPLLGVKTLKEVREHPDYLELVYLRKNQRVLMDRLSPGAWRERLENAETRLGLRLSPSMEKALRDMYEGGGVESDKRMREIRSKLRRRAHP